MIIKKQLLAITAVAMLTAAISGCQGSGNTNTTANNSAPANNAAANSAPANSTTDVPAAATSGGPTDAYKAAYAARKNKDVPALKKLLSKDILEFLTMIGEAGDKKQTLDQVLMEMCERPQSPNPDSRNEKIVGDKAKLEYLDEKGEWQIMDFVKEDGAWKLTIDKPENGADVQSPPANKPAEDKKDSK